MRDLVGRQDPKQTRSEVGAFSDWNPGMRRLFRKDAAFRTWQGSSGETDVSWNAFKDGPWQRMNRRGLDAKRNPRRIARRHDVEGAGRLLPCETAAIDSSRPQLSSRVLPLLDRMPRRANAAPLTRDLALFETFTRSTQERDYTNAAGDKKKGTRSTMVWAAAPTDRGAAAVPSRPTDAETEAYRKLCAQNATSFHHLEQSHPINFFEQRDVCEHCGAERFVTMNMVQCCQNGTLVLDRCMPAELLSLISEAPGLSKQSRVANDLFRFAQMALPKGAPRTRCLTL